MTDDRMDALRFAIDHQPPKKVGWWKRSGILVGILLYLVTALVAFVVAIVAAALALVPLLILLAMGFYLKVGSDRMRRLMADAPKAADLKRDCLCPGMGRYGMFVGTCPIHGKKAGPNCSCGLFLRDPTPAELAACPVHRDRGPSAVQVVAEAVVQEHRLVMGATQDTRPAPPVEPQLPPRRIYHESEIPKD